MAGLANPRLFRGLLVCAFGAFKDHFHPADRPKAIGDFSFFGGQHMDIPEMEYQGEFLRQWDDLCTRSDIVLMFVRPIQVGSRRPDLIIRDVIKRATFGVENEEYPEAKKVKLRKLLSQIEANPEDTQKFVEFLIERESWPIEKKQELRLKQKNFYNKGRATQAVEF